MLIRRVGRVGTMAGVVAVALCGVAVTGSVGRVGADANEAPPFLGAFTQGRISAGDQHSCALLDDGTVRCWGNNYSGQLGSTTNNNTNNPNPTPQPAVDLGPGRTAAAIATGGYHTCALLDNRTVRCWGSNFYGQLGSTTNNSTSNPNPTPQPAVDLGPGRTATAITTGTFHTCALLDNLTVRCWGYNFYGQLGTTTNSGTGNPNPTPQPPVDLGPGRTATAITTGSHHTCALLDNRTVRCWGLNGSGQLGSTTNNNTSNPNPTPQQAVDLGPGRTATAITTGEYHTCALLDNRTVRCWGNNRYGQLGTTTNNNTNNPNPTPQPPVDLGPGRTATAITTGNYHTCALLDNRTVRCWGYNYSGQLGSTTNSGTLNPNPTPQPPVDLGPGRTPKAITTGSNHTCALLDNGTVRCWGTNFYGQLGSTTNNTTNNPNPTPQPAVAGILMSVFDPRPVITSIVPSRYADSRTQPTFDNGFRNTGPRPTASVWEIKIAGRGNVPTTATAAVVNLTVTEATGNGFATIYPCGTRPNASSINYAPGVVSANEVITKLSPTGTICIYTHTRTHVIIDVTGHATNSAYNPLTPSRYADSRPEPTFDNGFRNTGPRPTASVWEIKIAGRGNVPTTATAAVVNLTVTEATGNGFATIYPCGTRPNASSINYAPGVVSANEVITKLSPTGTICIYTHTRTHVIIDVTGHATNSAYNPLTPSRYADSRPEPTFDNGFRNTGPRPTASVWEIKIAGRGNVPTTATAAVVNLTVTGATRNGFATIYPCGTRPNASSINYSPGTTRANEVIAKLSPTGTICIYTHTRTHVIIDVVGHIDTTARRYTPITPTRYADTRDQPTFDLQFRNTGPRNAGTTWEIQIAGRGQVPTTATAAVVNLTVTGATNNGFATIHPCGTRPNASSINYSPGTTRANEVIAKLSPTGTICIYTHTRTHVITDVTGFT